MEKSGSDLLCESIPKCMGSERFRSAARVESAGGRMANN